MFAGDNNFIMISWDSCNIADAVVKQILTTTSQRITLSQRAEQFKGKYSSSRVLDLIGQLSSQIQSENKTEVSAEPPQQQKSLMLDNHMSVLKVQHKEPVRRGRSKTKFGRELRSRLSVEGSSSDGFSRKSKKPQKYDNSQPLQEQEMHENSQQSDSSSDSSVDSRIEHYREQKLAEQIKKQQQLMSRATFRRSKSQLHTGEPNHKPKVDFKIPKRRRQTMIQDYNGDELKKKNRPQSLMVSQDQSLTYQISKKIEKLKVEKKKKKNEIIFIETKKILEKKKRREEKKKRRRTMIRQEVLALAPIKVQFSSVKSLADQFLCQAGVCFSQGSETIHHRTTNNRTMVTSITPSQRRISRNQYLILKKRSEHPLSQRYSTSMDKNQSTLVSNTFKKQLSLSVLDNEYSERSKGRSLTHRHQATEKIHISQDYLYEDLLSPFKAKGMTEQSNALKSPSNQDTVIPLSPNDRFNQKYIAQRRKGNRTKPNPSQIVTGGFLLPRIRDSYVKNRQKLIQRGAIYQAMNKKFEATLRNTSIIATQS